MKKKTKSRRIDEINLYYKERNNKKQNKYGT